MGLEHVPVFSIDLKTQTWVNYPFLTQTKLCYYKNNKKKISLCLSFLTSQKISPSKQGQRSCLWNESDLGYGNSV